LQTALPEKKGFLDMKKEEPRIEKEFTCGIVEHCEENLFRRWEGVLAVKREERRKDRSWSVGLLKRFELEREEKNRQLEREV